MGKEMLERKLVDLEFEAQTTDCGLAADRSANRMRTLLSAAATQPATARELAVAVVDEEVERLVSLDPAAAQRALDVLRIVRDRLAKTLSETRMAGVLSEALVRAADALPDQFEAERN